MPAARPPHRRPARSPWALCAVGLGVLAIACCIAATVLGYRGPDVWFHIGENQDGNHLGLVLRWIGGGLAALGGSACGCAFVRREHQRLCVLAALLALLALAWEFVLIGVVVAIVIVVVMGLAANS